jgi:hypothetical protein
MLFLQSVTKHADNLKDSNESKVCAYLSICILYRHCVQLNSSLLLNSKQILGGENGPLKDCFEGGATWAFDVGSQSMTCPIIVEDLERPRQMLVEV